MASAAFSQWVVQTSGTTTDLNNILFIDANTGTAVGLSGTVRKTTNGGASWFSQTAPAEHLFSIFYLNSTTGYICGNYTIIRTTNEGNTWVSLPNPGGLYRSIYFTDAQTGFCCGNAGEILRTTNSGDNWSPLTGGTSEFLYNVKFLNTSTGIIVGSNGTIIKTTNAGDNWTSYSTGLTDLFSGLAIIDANTLFVSGENGKIVKSTNGGVNWILQNSGTTNRITNLSFVNASTGTGSAHGNTIIRTTNGGASWVTQVSGLTGQLFNGVSFVNAQTGWIAGSNGNILYTTRGGFPIPSAPNLLLPVNGAVNVSVTAVLDWDSVTTAKTYQVQIDDDTLYASPLLDSTQVEFSTLTVPAGTLANNQPYFWRVRSENAGGVGPWSVNFRFRTIVSLPLAPGLLLPVNGASNVPLTPSFDWDSTSPADFYRFQASLDTSFSNPQVDITGITESFLNLTSPQLQNNFRYYWRVSATNPAGTGPWSAKFNFTTVIGMPAAPTLLTPVNNAENVSITPLLTWVEDISSTAYQMQLSADSTFATTLIDAGSFNTPQYQVGAGVLANYVKYFWRVRTTNPVGTGPWSEPSRFTTIIAVPFAPQLVDPPNNAIDVSTTPTLNWDSVQFAASFRLQLATDSNFTSPLINASGLTFSQLNVAGGLLQNNTTYFWRVNATNFVGTGPYSQIWKFRTITSPPVAAPSLISPPNGATNQILTPTLDWNDVFGSNGYKVLVSVDSFFNTTLIDTTLTPSQYTVPAGRLNGSSRYYWKVRGFNVGGFGPWSVTWRFNTQVIGITQIGSSIPDKFMLYDNFPNPFNPVTRIKFDIPAGINSGSMVKLVVYDITGRETAILVNESLSPGRYEASWNASEFSSGIYIYRLEAGDFVSIKKMVLVK